MTSVIAKATYVGELPFELEGELRRVASEVARLPRARSMVLYGSYAKGTQTPQSDVDLAVFFEEDDVPLLEKYRQLVKICKFSTRDIQIQAFRADELIEPCGIIEEIVEYGMEVPLPRE